MVKKKDSGRADGYDICMQLGKQVRALRLARGWTQEQLGEACGLHGNYVGDLERGRINIGLTNLGKLAQGLGVSVSELLDGGPTSLGIVRVGPT